MDTVALLNTVRADRSGVHDDLADVAPRWRALRDAARVLAAERTDDPRPVAEGHEGRVAQAVATLNATAALAPGWPTLVDGRVVWASAVAAEDRALADAAAEAVRFFASEVELRACLAPGCVLYFVKEHHRQAWCSVGCGNRERAARHYARHR
ncbi:CGNR zinc finger domain-containing protein [Nocardioides anomalus]|uniref:CGNR zinc finger domain-containing protein n=1 Tax=Nocardioides anomalus TaxID=2712223 RepID=A0A6G6W9K1_9ACTN|nr:CGNR zinc finger domain-containing protein [Nocardioides anomalus]QIG41827.1 CGNR zinc finger domain-containing protein [Nocardioides anomalus]